MAFEYLVALGPSVHHHLELCIDRQNPMVKPTILVEAFGHPHPVVFNFEKSFAHQDRLWFNDRLWFKYEKQFYFKSIIPSRGIFGSVKNAQLI